MAQLGEASTLMVIKTQASSLSAPSVPDSLRAGTDHVLLLALKPPAQHRKHELKRKHR